MATMSSLVVNGVMPLGQLSMDEVVEFDKILKLRDDIFAGTHPRLTVPAHLLRKVSPSSASSSTPLSSHFSAPVPTQQSQSQSYLPGLTLTQDVDAGHASSVSVQASTHTASGIDPVLLTKSDDLVRAESALQRNRLEKNLRDQFEQKRLEFRKRPAPAEAKPDFDLRAVLAKVLETAKPVSVSKDGSDKEADNESFDENSFYSSKAPDSTPERPEESVSEEGVEHVTTTRTAVVKSAGRPNESQPDADDEDEEGEYSPPEADQYPARNGTSSQNVPDARIRQMRRYSDLDQNNKRPASPSDANMRIGRQYQNGRPRGRENSPSQSPETVQQRNKRRKLERKAEKRGKRGVKQENISPPPFHDIQPLGANRPQPVENRPIVIDEAPQEVRYAPEPRYIESPQRPLSRQAEFVPLSEPRVYSRAGMRQRDDQDLRRVASMHNLRIEQPREYIEYASPVPQRSTSYMKVDSPVQDIRYVSDSDRPLQEVRVIRTPAPEYRDIYQPEPEVRYLPEAMPPLPRERIVVDHYGRRYREVIQERIPEQSNRAMSAYPREIPQYYDTPPRAGSVMIDDRPVPQPRFEQEMPPPRMVRQAVEEPIQLSSPMRSSQHREVYDSAMPAARASNIIYDRPPQARQVVYADEGDYRSPVRMSSVRPPASRYEEQPMMLVPRAGSVRPGTAREPGAYPEDRGQVRYRIVEENQPLHYQQIQTRYVDAQGREVIPRG